jgi:hypothetical protein
MVVGEGQTITLSYEAEDSSGVSVGTIEVTIHVNTYGNPVITNGGSNTVNFEIFYANTPNNSYYSGPCWAIALTPG